LRQRSPAAVRAVHWRESFIEVRPYATAGRDASAMAKSVV
jgi:hypothetical protein